jgi:RNA polymerase sigma-70 factor (ECF subfamily)
METIVENKATDLRRRFLDVQKRDVSRERSLSAGSEFGLEQVLKNSTMTPLDKLISVEQMQQLQELVQQLPGEYREVIWMRHHDGLSFPEMAARLNRSVSSVKATYLRAVESLIVQFETA